MTSAWKCDLCGYVHNASDAPDFCPVCGAEKLFFSLLEIRRSSLPKENTGLWQCSICDHIEKGTSPPESCPICGATAMLFHPFTKKGSQQLHADIQKLLILGSGIAGFTVAEEARRLTKNIEITILSKEKSLPYYRLNLTRYLAGEVHEQDLLIQQQEWFDAQNIKYICGEAKSINRKTQRVALRDGKHLDYDRLVLSNGAHAFVPPFPGVKKEGVHILRTIENAHHLIDCLHPGIRVVCIGGGLLGLETAWALKKREAQVTVLEGFNWLLPRQLPEKAAELLKRHLEHHQMTIECGTQVKEFSGDESIHAVVLEDGREIPTDLVILATGVRPNTHLARECGLKVHNGVIVDDHLFTSDQNILAAGDVTEHQGQVYGIWPASYAQGLVAGINAVGGRAEFQGIPMTNRIKVLDVDLFSIGQILANDASTRLFEHLEDGEYRGIICHDGQVVGAVLYGDMQLTGYLQEAVEEGKRIQELNNLAHYFPGLKETFHS